MKLMPGDRVIWNRRNWYSGSEVVKPVPATVYYTKIKTVGIKVKNLIGEVNVREVPKEQVVPERIELSNTHAE